MSVVAILLISFIRVMIGLQAPSSSQRHTPPVFGRTPPVVASEASNTAPFFAQRAIDRQLSGDLDGAFADNSKAIELDPFLPYPHHNLGIIKVLRNDLNGARSDFNTAIRLDPKYASAYRNLGYIKDAQGDLDGAIADCTRAIELDPRDYDAWRYRGVSRQSQGKFKDAIADYTRAIELNPSDSSAWSSRASSHKNLNEPELALADFTRAIELNPTSKHSWHYRGHTWCDLQNFKRAISDFTKAIELDPETAELCYDRGCAQYDLQDWKGCIRDLVAAIAKAPSLRDRAQIRLYFALSRLGQKEDADQALQAYLKKRGPQDGDSWTLEILNFVAGLTSEVEFLRKNPSIEGKPESQRTSESYYFAGTMRLIRGDSVHALELFQHCLLTPERSFPEFDTARAELKVLDRSH